MATTVYSELARKQAGTDTGKTTPSDFGGKVRVARCVYKPTKADEAGTVIHLVKLPAGARICPRSALAVEAGQNAALTISVGDELNDKRYLNAQVVKAEYCDFFLKADVLNGYRLEKEMWINATTGAQVLTVGKRLVFEILYVLD